MSKIILFRLFHNTDVKTGELRFVCLYSDDSLSIEELECLKAWCNQRIGDKKAMGSK